MNLNKKYFLALIVLIVSFGFGFFVYAQTTQIDRDFDFNNNNTIYNLDALSIGTAQVNSGAITFSDGTTLSSASASGLWSTNANGIDYGGGNVGIGDTTPSANLDVNGPIYGTIVYDKDNSSYYLNPTGTSNLGGRINFGSGWSNSGGTQMGSDTDPSRGLEFDFDTDRWFLYGREDSGSSESNELILRIADNSDDSFLIEGENGASVSNIANFALSPGIDFYQTIDANSNKIINLGSPSSASDAATKSYVDSTVSGGTVNNADACNGDSYCDITMLDFSNQEMPTGSGGRVYFDENFYPSGEAGAGVFSGNGGGLAVYNEDGWGAIYTTANDQWATPQFDNLDLNNNSQISVGAGPRIDFGNTGSGNENDDLGIVATGDGELNLRAGGAIDSNSPINMNNNNINNANSVYGDIFYDDNNTSYYANPAGTSAFNNLQVQGEPVTQCNSASLSSSGWYRIADNGPVSNGGSGGDRATGKFVVWDTESGRHSSTVFYASVHYGNNPTLSLLNRSWYSGDGVIRDIRLVEGDTYEGAAVEIYFVPRSSGDSASVNYCIYENVQSSGWSPVDWTSGSKPSGFGDTNLNLDSKNPVMAIASDGETDEFWIDRSGRVYSNQDIRAPVFYDQNNTSYYVNPSSGGTSLNTNGDIDLNSPSNTSDPHGILDAGFIELVNQETSYPPQTDGMMIFDDSEGPMYYDDGNWHRFFTEYGAETSGLDLSVDKLDANTVDPVYNINNKQYATYMAGMTGVKEETTGSINLKESDNKYSYTIDFDEVEKGSDLWLFWQTTDFGKDWSNLSILLTQNFNGNVWYEKNPNKNTLKIYGTQKGEVSYRLTALRFDHSKWDNSYEGDAKGMTIPVVK